MTEDMSIESLQKVIEMNLMTDKFLVPFIFVCGEEGITTVDTNELSQDTPHNDINLTALVNFISNKKAYKVILISETIVYKAPETMTPDQVQEVIDMDRLHYRFEAEEVYQIMEITHEKVRVLTKPFYRNEEVDAITFGEETFTENIQAPMILKTIQESLTDIS